MGRYHWDRRPLQIGDMRVNQRRPRRVDETVSTIHGCNEGVGIRHVINKGACRSIVGNLSQPLEGLRDNPNEASGIHIQFS